ncbi:unnamed protein product [Toxocara canis]|uniref:Aminotransferase class I/II-fold pyridoxal phosphate-dependent enzyme n=1 Tax=Toxocara canis TaxID=6265 RepID=A0A183VAS7_TOXCA|nr:unnamed protein product [Toxocara canis]
MEADEISMKIGSLVADNLVDDGATLQLGIGKIPDSTLRAMKGHKDLGVHTEALADGVTHLMRRNVITNARKSTDVGKVVTTYAHGTRRLYEFIDNNPAFCRFSFALLTYFNFFRVVHRLRILII